MTFERIRNLREDNDIRQKQIAEYLHVSQNTYSQYENGIISLSAENAVRLAEFYHTSTDYLLGLTDQKSPYPKSGETKTAVL